MTTIHVVNSFTTSPEGGNPAGVCLLDAPLPEQQMQHIAAEMNLSETAFVVPEGAGHRIRWFTPTVEVVLCGHATLASAHVMWETGAVAPDATIRFQSLSGELVAKRAGEWIELDFPSNPPSPTEPSPELEKVLGAEIESLDQSSLGPLALLANAQAVRSLTPDLDALQKLGFKGICITAAGDTAEFDFVSRYFGPGYGIPEDPVTGAAHCVLAPFWAKQLGKAQMTAFQASSRGGTVRVRLEGDRVILGGQALTVNQRIL